MMTCHVVDAKPAMGVVFICGEAEEPALCHFCGQPAAYLCDWKTRKRVCIRADALNIGDVRVMPIGRVIYCLTDRDTTFLAFDLGGQVQQVKVPASALMQVWREGTCDQPACYFCVREVDDKVHHCKDHWREAGSVSA